MDFYINFTPEKSHELIEPHHKILLIGSCFTEHMATRLEKWGWTVFQNPTGVIYNPHSVQVALDRIFHKKMIMADELYEHGDVFHHWDFHSKFSQIDRAKALEQMNSSIERAHEFLMQADWLFLTWGSAHFYSLAETGYQVSNCHRVPNKLFTKSMYEIEVMYSGINDILSRIRSAHPNIKVCQTVSPVRHIKDGIVENSRSKARLIELSHLLEVEGNHYFPAYEILIDQLRDYRFFDADLVHPNYAATQYVWEKFTEAFFSEDSERFLRRMIDLSDAYNHKPRFSGTPAHGKFLKKYLHVCEELEKEYNHLDLQKFRDYFSNQSASC